MTGFAKNRATAPAVFRNDNSSARGERETVIIIDAIPAGDPSSLPALATRQTGVDGLLSSIRIVVINIGKVEAQHVASALCLSVRKFRIDENEAIPARSALACF
jgi:hypothetical protein